MPTIDVGPQGSLVISMDIESIERLGPVVVELAERHGADVIDVRAGTRLSTPYGEINWADRAADARKRHQADLASLLESIDLVGNDGDRDEVMTVFASLVGGGGPAVVHTTMPGSIDEPYLPLPDPAPLPDLRRTLRLLHHGRRHERAMAAFRLGGHPPTTETINPLRKALSSDPDAYVRTVAGKSLAVIGDTSVFEPLQSLMPSLPQSVAPSELTQAVSNVLHALVLIALVDRDRDHEVAGILSSTKSTASHQLGRRIARLESVLQDRRR